jgi:hypothetical protein
MPKATLEDTVEYGTQQDIVETPQAAPINIPPPEPTEQPGAGSRMLNAFLDETLGLVKGTLWDVPKAEIEALVRNKGQLGATAKDILNQFVVQPSMEQAYKSVEAYNRPPSGKTTEERIKSKNASNIEARLRGAATVPIIGPMIANLAEATIKDPAAGTGRIAANIVPMLLGKGIKAGGKNLGVRGAPMPKGPIPGAYEMSLEAPPPGFFKGVARAKSRGPAGAKLVEEALQKRDVSVKNALEGSMANISETSALPEQIGATIKSRAGQMLAAEEARAPRIADIATERANLQANRMQTNFERRQTAREAATTELRGSIEAEGLQKARDIAAQPGGVLGTPEASGKALREALEERIQTNIPRKLEPVAGEPPSVADIESALWEPINLQMKDITPDISNIRTIANDLKGKYLGSEEELASSISPGTRKIIEKATQVEGAPTIPEEYAGLPPEAQQIILEQMQAMPTEVAPPTWAELHLDRQGIDKLIAKSKSGLIPADIAALKKLREAITDSMRSSIQDQGLLREFEQANAMTKYKHEAFGEGVTGDILKRQGATPPSEIIDKLVKGTPEEARRFVNAVGSNALIGPELKTAVRRNLLERHKGEGVKGEGAIDYRAALHDLQKTPTYKELLRPNDYNSMVSELKANADMYDMPKVPELAVPKAVSKIELPGAKATTEISAGAKEPSVGKPKVEISRTQRETDALALRKSLAGGSPEQMINKILGEYKSTDMRDVANMLNKTEKKQLQRASMKKLLDESIGEGDMVNGPKLEKSYKKHRDALKAAGLGKKNLKELDSLANELKKYSMSIEHTRGAQWGGLAETGVLTSGVTGAITSTAMGSPGIGMIRAGASAASLLTPKALLKVFLQPNGPHLLARYFKTGKWSEDLGKIVGGSSMSVPVVRNIKPEGEDNAHK